MSVFLFLNYPQILISRNEQQFKTRPKDWPDLRGKVRNTLIGSDRIPLMTLAFKDCYMWWITETSCSADFIRIYPDLSYWQIDDMSLLSTMQNRRLLLSWKINFNPQKRMQLTVWRILHNELTDLQLCRCINKLQEMCFWWTVGFCECKGHVSGVITSAAARFTPVSEVCNIKAQGEEDSKGFIVRKQVVNSPPSGTQKQTNSGHICLFVHRLAL